MPRSLEDYQHIMPLALDWLGSVEQYILENGRALSESELQDAVAVGVCNPTEIRLLKVASVTRPAHPALLQAATETGLLGESANARAVGYGIEVVDGLLSRRLLRHECRHVYQFEQAGSLDLFISAYIESVLSSGYFDSTFEQDARAYEVASSSH